MTCVTDRKTHVLTCEQNYDRIMPQDKAPSTPATMSKQRSTLLPKTATMSNVEFIVKFRPFHKVECCFDTVAVFLATILPVSTKSKQIEHVQFVSNW